MVLVNENILPILAVELFVTYYLAHKFRNRGIYFSFK